MTILQIIQSQYASAITGGLGGIATAWLSQRILNKRGTLSFIVNHQRIGLSTDDAIFGSVSVTWNGSPIANLYMSTIEIKNESMNDYENIILHTHTTDTDLLTEYTQIIGTPISLEWSDKYKNTMQLPPGTAELSLRQIADFKSKREYIVPTLNRGQVIKLSYLNAAKNASPNIWLAINQKGIRLKYSTPQNQIFGVPQPQAAFVGVLIGFTGLFIMLSNLSNPWVIGTASLTYGLIAQAPGAYLIKMTRKIREGIGG